MNITGVFVACSVKYLIITYLFFASCFVNAQSFLNDTINVSLTGTYLHSLYEVDSGYYWVGMVPHPTEPGNPNQFLFGFVSYNGDWSVKTLEYDSLQNQKSAFSINQLIMNNAGNFVHAFTNCGNGNCYPRIKEFTSEGTILQDTIFTGIVDSFGLVLYDFTNVYYNITLNTYSILANCGDTAKLNAGMTDFGINLYLEIDENFDIVDTVYFTDPNQTHSYLSGYQTKIGNKTVVMLQDKMQAGNNNEEAKLVFYEKSNSEAFSKVGTYNQGQYDVYSFGLTTTSDSSLLFAYVRSQWDVASDDWLFSNTICKLDTNYNLLWESPLYFIEYPTPGTEVFPWRIIETPDSNYVVAEGGYEDGTILTMFSFDGEQIWRRRILKPIQEIPDTLWTGTEIRDLIANSRGGFTLFGTLREWPLVGGIPAGRHGYIAETNCLGFMAPPEAHSDYKIEDNFQVSFYNNSMQAGSYTWDFGDGTVVQTDEYTDTLSHTYQGFGEYTVTLIAYGCNDENDTLSFTVQPALHTDPSVVTDGQGFFSIFPNPVHSGEQLFVYLNDLDPSSNKIALQFLDEQGRIAQEVQINATEGTYILSPNLAAGVYFVNLVQEETLLQSRKLIVH
ncbi:PKD domain-containing protein [Crocinitomicaceae bacterium]|nr:PKD domain-containing protein [Crocinitomicaceae bacterium]